MKLEPSSLCNQLKTYFYTEDSKENSERGKGGGQTDPGQVCVEFLCVESVYRGCLCVELVKFLCLLSLCFECVCVLRLSVCKVCVLSFSVSSLYMSSVGVLRLSVT